MSSSAQLGWRQGARRRRQVNCWEGVSGYCHQPGACSTENDAWHITPAAPLNVGHRPSPVECWRHHQVYTRRNLLGMPHVRLFVVRHMVLQVYAMPRSSSRTRPLGNNVVATSYSIAHWESPHACYIGIGRHASSRDMAHWGKSGKLSPCAKTTTQWGKQRYHGDTPRTPHAVQHVVNVHHCWSYMSWTTPRTHMNGMF